MAECLPPFPPKQVSTQVKIIQLLNLKSQRGPHCNIYFMAQWKRTERSDLSKKQLRPSLKRTMSSSTWVFHRSHHSIFNPAWHAWQRSFQDVFAFPHLISSAQIESLRQQRRSISFSSKMLTLSSYLYLKNTLSPKRETVHVWRHQPLTIILLILGSVC